MRRRDLDKRIIAADSKYTATPVKEDGSSQLIDKAKIIIAKITQTVTILLLQTSMAIIHGRILKRMRIISSKQDMFTCYETNEFTIAAKELNDKKTWEVLLKKTEAVKPNEKSIRLGGVSVAFIAKATLYARWSHRPNE